MPVLVAKCDNICKRKLSDNVVFADQGLPITIRKPGFIYKFFISTVSIYHSPYVYSQQARMILLKNALIAGKILCPFISVNKKSISKICS